MFFPVLVIASTCLSEESVAPMAMTHDILEYIRKTIKISLVVEIGTKHVYIGSNELSFTALATLFLTMRHYYFIPPFIKNSYTCHTQV